MTALIFIHRGDSWYLWYTLRQARLSNPATPIYLISDRHTPAYDAFAQFVPMQDHLAEAEAFAAIYRHRSTHPVSYELFCLQRWFMLASFLRTRPNEPAVYLDSDTLVYTGLAAEQRRYAGCDLAITRTKGPQTTFVRDAAALERFCAFVTARYTHDTAELETRYQQYRAAHREGGITDMTMLADYAARYPERVADTYVIQNGAIYDHNINQADGFATARRGMKRFIWRGARPFSRHLSSGQLVRFHTIHCQGGAKLLIPQFASRRDAAYYQRLLFHTPLRTTVRGMVLRVWR